MAKAYKCDRCGKLFEKYKHQGTSEFFNITHFPCMSGNCLDLCPNCNAELQAWVKAGSEGDEKRVNKEKPQTMVAIKGMKMPKNCEKCPLFHFYLDTNGTIHFICKCGNIEMCGELKNKRNDSCPLIEVDKAESEVQDAK